MKRRIAFWILLAAAVAWLFWFMVATPGEPYRGALPEASDEEKRLAAALRKHIEAIATREHNQFTPAELEAAARYLESTLSAFGFSIQKQSFKTSMGEVRNL
jgi:hypothetical protein